MQFPRPTTVLGTTALAVLLGIISSALWDFLFKPGVTEFGRVLLTIFTLGSESIRDSAYASAALDPTPLPALVAVLLASWLPLLVASELLGRAWGRRTADKSHEHAEKIASGDSEKLAALLKERVDRLKRRKARYTWIFLIVTAGVSVTAASVLNQSIVIWRVFHANVAICAPHLTTTEEKTFLARFASMTTKRDYVTISQDLEQIAKKNGVRLLTTQLW